MQKEQWTDIKEIFERVCDLTTAEAQTYLDETCPAGTEIRTELESLLSAYRSAGDFIQKPVLFDRDVISEEIEDPLIGTDLGTYRIVREIDRGGMGMVYEAVRADDEYQKQVAIKIVQRGLDNKSLLHRFRNERQILANLDHPNIARLLDGGTTNDGRPYFVMEFVDGTAIDKYCDSHRLKITERLRLFQTIAKAVHYAHQHLVIHRDLKPSNILVTSEGIPKLLDFGIAKVFDASISSAVDLTLDVLPMTPQYASPEQVRGEPMTTATDVYSLGVVLFQLLTGHSPYKLTGNAAEIVKAVCELQPPKPSVAIKQTNGSTGLSEIARDLGGDLDNIVLKALHKDPSRRYSSTLELADDIERYLDGKPVIARQDTAWYRTGRFVRRHKIGVTVAALATTMLVAAFVVTAFQYRVAERERLRAQRRFDDVRQLANTFIFGIHDSIQFLPGSMTARQSLVETASRYLDSLARESENDQALQKDLASAYERLSEIQGGIGQANIGNSEAATESLRRAVSIRKALSKANPDSLETRLEWAAGMSRLAERTLGPDAQQMARQAVDIMEPAYAASPSPDSGTRLAGVYYTLGSTAVTAGKFEDGLQAFSKDTHLLEALLRETPTNGDLWHSLALVSKRVGAILGSRGNYDEAFKRYRRALEIEQEFLRYNPVNVAGRRSLSVTYSDLGWLSNRSGDLKGAMENYKKALEIRQSLADADPANVDIRDRLSVTLASIAEILQAQRDWSQAEGFFRKALAIREQIAERYPSNAFYIFNVAAVYMGLGDLARNAKNLEKALQLNERALALVQSASAMDLASRDGRVKLAMVHGNLGLTYFQMASLRVPDSKSCQALERAFASLSQSNDLFAGIRQAGELTNLDEAAMGEYRTRLVQTGTQLAEWRRAKRCPAQ